MAVNKSSCSGTSVKFFPLIFISQLAQHYAILQARTALWSDKWVPDDDDRDADGWFMITIPYRIE